MLRPSLYRYKVLVAAATMVGMAPALADIESCKPLASPVIYIIQKGDQLGDISRTFGFYPLWGMKTGQVTQLAANSGIADLNYIRVGDPVHLPFKCEEEVNKYLVLNRGNYRQIDPRALVRVHTYPKRKGEMRTTLIFPDGHEIPLLGDSQLATIQAQLPDSVADKGGLVHTSTPSSPDAAESQIDEGDNGLTGLLSSSQVLESETSTNDSVIDDSPESQEFIAPGKEQALSDMPRPTTIALSPQMAAEATPQTSNPKTYSVLGIGLRYQFLRLDSSARENQATALLFSQAGAGVQVSWRQIWSEQLSSEFGAYQQNVAFNSASAGSIENSNIDLGGFDFSLGYKSWQWLDLRIGIGLDSRIYARSLAPGFVTLDEIQQARYGLAFNPVILELGSFALDLNAKLDRITARQGALYEIDDGHEFTISPRLRQKLNQIQMEVKLSYQASSQRSTISSQEISTIGITSGVSVELGK